MCGCSEIFYCYPLANTTNAIIQVAVHVGGPKGVNPYAIVFP